MSATQIRQHQQHVDQVLEFMRRRGLSVDDLVEYGGEDFKSSNSRRVEKAGRVEKCWALMAWLGVNHVDLPEAAGQSPDNPGPRRRHRPAFEQPIDLADISRVAPSHSKRSKFNDLALSSPIGVPELNFGDVGASEAREARAIEAQIDAEGAS
jgi:hypothetical protein